MRLIVLTLMLISVVSCARVRSKQVNLGGGDVGYKIKCNAKHPERCVVEARNKCPGGYTKESESNYDNQYGSQKYQKHSKKIMIIKCD